MADNYEVASAFVRLRPKVDGFAKDAEQQIGSPLKKIAAGAALAFGAVKVAGIFRDAISEQREALRVGRQTEAVLKSTGGTAGVTAGDVGKLADKLSKIAAVDDEVVQRGENLLLTFTSIRNEVGKGNNVFDRATAAALDMSAAFGTDLQGSIVMVGKALQDPVRGITALRRAGADFNAEEQKTIKNLVDSGHLLDAQKFILRELEKEFGGAAAAAADPIARFHVAAQNLAESLGTAVTPELNVAARGVSSLSEGFLALPSGVQTSVVTLGTAATAAIAGQIAFTKLSEALEGTALAAAASKVGLGGLVAAGPQLVGIGAIATGTFLALKSLFGDNNAEWRKAAGDMTKAFAQTAGALDSVSAAAITADLKTSGSFEKLTRAGFTVRDVFNAAKGPQKEAFAALAEIGRQAGLTGGQIQHLGAIFYALRDGSKEAKQLSRFLGGVADGEEAAADAAKDFADASQKAMDSTIGHFLDVRGAALGVTAAEASLNEAIHGTGDAADTAGSKMKTYADAVTQVFDSVLSADRAHMQARDAMSRLTESVASNTKAAAAGARGLIRLDGQQASSADDVHGALLDVIDAREKEVESEAQSGEIADTAQARHQALVDSLLDLRNQYPALAGDIDKYITAARKIPELPLQDAATKTAGAQKNLADATLNVVTALQRQASADDDPIHGLLTMDQTLGSLLDKYKRFPEAAGVLSGAIAAVDSAIEKEAALLGINVATLEQLLSSGISGNLLSALADPKTGGDVARLIATPRASGGPVRAGVPYWVGEKRPELFVPQQSGTIIADPRSQGRPEGEPIYSMTASGMAAKPGWTDYGNGIYIEHLEVNAAPGRDHVRDMVQELRSLAYLIGM